jgi:NAD(P)-dependent dehydrogenase (short-subunit alcohol dehydrogenase family)
MHVAPRCPDVSEPAALVTGGSRGIGAATVRQLAMDGFDVAFTYRSKKKRAQQIAAEASAFGRRVLPLASDMTVASDIASMARDVAAWTPRLDLLVLSASGGLERELVAADANYPLRINRDAQLASLHALLPLMSASSTVVFVTSHWAHLYGRVQQLPAYEPVARSKHAGEHALRQTLAAAGQPRLIVVTGDLVDGTTTPKLLERVSAGVTQARRERVGVLPTAEDMARAIARAAMDRSMPSGQTVVVGGPLDSLTA